MTGGCEGAASGAGIRFSKVGIGGAGDPRRVVGSRTRPPWFANPPTCPRPPLAHELVRRSAGTRRVEPPARGGLAAWQQRIVSAYIEEHIAEQIPLATLAHRVRLSPYHFCRAFKRSFGVPPHLYHNARRIDQAKTLLARLTCSVTEIALTLGFSETSSFTAAFRKATGSTPTAYRRSLG